VTPENINAIIDDLQRRETASEPQWKDTTK
jgi:hypothetical protein